MSVAIYTSPPPPVTKCPSCWSMLIFKWDDLCYSKKRGAFLVQCPECKEDAPVDFDLVPPFHATAAKGRAK